MRNKLPGQIPLSESRPDQGLPLGQPLGRLAGRSRWAQPAAGRPDVAWAT